MKREEAVEVANLVHRIEMLEHQLDFLESLKTYEPKSTDFENWINTYGIFTEEDKNDLISITNEKLNDAQEKLKRM